MSALSFVLPLSGDGEDAYEIRFTETQPDASTLLYDNSVTIELFKNGKAIAHATEPRASIRRLGEVLGGRP